MNGLTKRYSPAKGMPAFVTTSLLLCLLAWSAAAASAATITVTSTGDSGPGSLRDAVAAANPDDTIIFADGVTEVVLTSGELVFQKNLFISGGGSVTVRRDPGADPFRIIHVVFGSRLEIDGLRISGGSGVAGGGIYSTGAMVIRNSTISQNLAVQGGGYYGDGTLTVTGSTFSGNSASDGGGAVMNFGTATFSNSTISGNYSASNGGGFTNWGPLTVTSSTIVRNSAGDRGGIASPAPTTLSNSIVAENTGYLEVDLGGNITGSYNLIGDGAGTSFVDGVDGNQVGTTGSKLSPQLAGLALLGGPTMVHIPEPGSPAIDLGEPAVTGTDQRGAARPAGNAVDIGAVEVQGNESFRRLVVTTLADENDGTVDPSAGSGTSLREAIIEANGRADFNVINFAVTGEIVLSDRGMLMVSGNMGIDGPGSGLLKVRRDSAAPDFGIFWFRTSSTARLSGLTISGGRASFDAPLLAGGGILVGGTLDLNAVTVSGNFAIAGGGIYNSGILTVTNSSIENNSSQTGGGIDNNAALTVTDSTVSGNSATNWGGGISNYSGTGTISGSTISGNTTPGLGGGVYNATQLSMVSTTVTANAAGNSGGGLMNLSAASVNSTIVAGNQAGDGSELYTQSAMAGGSNFVGGDPQLGPLVNNGGPTKTHAPVCGSPVIDKGQNFGGLASDQRGAGYTRTVDLSAVNSEDGTDVGAFEVQSDAGCSNAAPVADDQTVTVDQSATAEITLTGSDSDLNALTFSIGTQPSHGSLSSISGATVTYTPSPGYYGTDSFTFTANDGQADSNVATVTINVTGPNRAPVVVADEFSVDQGAVLQVAAPGVLGNDLDPDGDPLTASLYPVAINGSLTLQADGSFTYSPNPGFTGTDYFYYEASDGSVVSGLGEVRINVIAVNQPPLAKNDGYSVNAGQELIVPAPGLLANDSDPEGNALTVAGHGEAANGILSVFGSGEFSYKPNAGFVGVDSFTYNVTDGNSNSNKATVTITVKAVVGVPQVVMTNNSQFVQYSDAIANIVITASDSDSNSLTGAVSYATGRDPEVPGLPAGLLLSAGKCKAAGRGVNCTWTISGRANVEANQYFIRFVARDNTGKEGSAEAQIAVEPEAVTFNYSSEQYALTSGPEVTSVAVRLSAALTQEADGNSGNLALARVRFDLYRGTNFTEVPDLTISDVPVDSAGIGQTTVNLTADVWTVKVRMVRNRYWASRATALGIVTVEVPTNEVRTGGGGWVADLQARDGRGNFGFSVANTVTGPRGTAVYLFTGQDGFNYLFKSTAWQGGSLAFAKDGQIYPITAFGGSGVAQKIDPRSGEVVESTGNLTFLVDAVDGDLYKPKKADRYAIKVVDSAGNIWRQVGTRTSPLTLGGGNVTVKAR